MEYFWILLCTFPLLASGLILPMVDTDGKPDYVSMISHMALMEQTISGLQTSFQATQTRVTTLEAKLTEKENELASNKHDLEEIKSRLSAAERDVAVLRAKQENYPTMREFAQVKSDITSLRTMSNSSAIDVIGADVKAHSKAIESLASRQNTSESKMADTAHQVELVNSEMNARAQEISSLLHQQTASNLNVSHLLAMSTSVTTNVHDMTRNLSQLSDKVARLLTQKDNVAFQVANKASHTTGHTILRFDTVLVNNGGGYNKNTGIFTAPVKGSYLFWVDVDVEPETHATEHADHICIIKDGQCLQKAYAMTNPDNGMLWTVASTMAVTNLIKGQTIHFEIGSTNSHIGGVFESCYGGALLRADYD